VTGRKLPGGVQVETVKFQQSIQLQICKSFGRVKKKEVKIIM